MVKAELRGLSLLDSLERKHFIFIIYGTLFMTSLLMIMLGFGFWINFGNAHIALYGGIWSHSRLIKKEAGG